MRVVEITKLYGRRPPQKPSVSHRPSSDTDLWVWSVELKINYRGPLDVEIYRSAHFVYGRTNLLRD